MFSKQFSRLTALVSSAALVSILAIPSPALARNDTLRKLLVLGAAALVVKAVIDNQRRNVSTPIYNVPGLTHAQIADVQLGLRQAGYYNGRIDGVWGNQTKQALLYWQRANGYRPTGILTSAQQDRLEQTTAGRFSASNSTIYATPLRDRNDYGATNLTHSQMIGLQTDLQFLGYYSGPLDGVWGRHSQAALERFRLEQRSHGGQELHAQPGVMDLASVAVSARQMEEDISRDLDQRLSRSAF